MFVVYYDGIMSIPFRRNRDTGLLIYIVKKYILYIVQNIFLL
jgi:hypothetical protein